MCPTETFFLKGPEVGITANKNLSCGELTSLFCQISIGFISSFSDFRSQDCNKNRKVVKNVCLKMISTGNEPFYACSKMVESVIMQSGSQTCKKFANKQKSRPLPPSKTRSGFPDNLTAPKTRRLLHGMKENTNLENGGSNLEHDPLEPLSQRFDILKPTNR
jgi:hypothetical protein